MSSLSSKRLFWFRLTVPMASILLFLFVAEIILRLAGVDAYFQNRFFVVNRALDYHADFKKDRELFWRFRPDREVASRFFKGNVYRINSLGLHGPEISPVKTRRRLMALGNSCTFGWGVADDEPFTARLQTYLSDTFTVINGGIPGYSSYQGRRFFESELVNLNPDVVLIMFAWNDIWAAAGGIADKDQQFPPRSVIGIQNQLSRLHTYRLLKKLLLSPIEENPDSLFDRASPTYRVEINDYMENLHAICQTARAHDCTPVLMTSPIASLETYYPPGVMRNLHRFHGRYNEAVRSLATSGGIDLVDLAAQFDLHTDLYDDAPNDPMHFNARGHELVAQLVISYLRDSLKILPG